MGIWLLYSKRGGGNFLVSGHVLRILCATGAGDDDEDTVRATMMEMCCQMKKASGRCRPDSTLTNILRTMGACRALIYADERIRR